MTESAARPFLTSPRSLALAVAAFVALSLLFWLRPDLDIAASHLFFDGAGSFPVSEKSGFVFLRDSGRNATGVIVFLLVMLFVFKLAGSAWGRVLGNSHFLYLSVTLALGPGLIVNRILKAFWGRPRPFDSEAFGGEMRFMPAWVPGGQCPANCSFVSGEASQSFWFLAVAFIVPPRWRTLAIAGSMLWAVAISVNRMAFGAHFLSDVLIAWALNLVLLILCARWLLSGDVAARDQAIENWFAARRRQAVAFIAKFRNG